MIAKKLFIITEGGKELGFGHITRTISLSTYFISFGYEIQFLVNGDDSLNEILSSYSYKIYNWLHSYETLLQDLKYADLILLDSMQILDSQIKQLEALRKPIIFIDDEKQRNILESGFVIDWTVGRDDNNSFFPRKQNVHYFLGSLFTPLRKEFLNGAKNQINQNMEKMMITFGGSDIRNLTPLILEVLKTSFPNIVKDVIIGGGFNNIEEIKKHTTYNTNLIYNATAQQMIRVMQTSDIAVAAGGQTLYELAKIGLPTIGILVVENAKDDTLGWNKTGFLKYIGRFDNLSLKENLIDAINDLSSYARRVQMQKDGFKHMSQNGTQFLVEHITKGLNDSI